MDGERVTLVDRERASAQTLTVVAGHHAPLRKRVPDLIDRDGCDLAIGHGGRVARGRDRRNGVGHVRRVAIDGADLGDRVGARRVAHLPVRDEVGDDHRGASPRVVEGSDMAGVRNAHERRVREERGGGPALGRRRQRVEVSGEDEHGDVGVLG